MRILIVTHNYPPLNNIASSRPYSWAKYWGLSGNEIRVMTTKKFPQDGPLNYFPPSFKAHADEIPYWPYSHIDKNTYSSPYKIFDRLNHTKKNGWILPAVKFAENLYRHWPYETIVSTYSPLECHIIASMVKQHPNQFWVADYRDLLPSNPLKPKKGYLFGIKKIIEKIYLHKADIITTVSEPLKENLERLLHRPVAKIENGYDPDDFKSLKENCFPPDGKLRLIYAGTIYPKKRDPSLFFEAVRNLDSRRPLDGKLEILFLSKDSQYLRNQINLYRLNHIVKVCGLVDRLTCTTMQQNADGLLFLDWLDEDEKGIVSGKVFEYIFTGTPIISIGSSKMSSANQIINKSGTGIILSHSVKNIEKFIENFVNGKKIEYLPDRQYIEKYERKNLAEKLLEIIKVQKHKKYAENV